MPKSDNMEDALVQFAGSPSRWCKEYLKLFGLHQEDVYLPSMVALYEKQCREKFGTKASA